MDELNYLNQYEKFLTFQKGYSKNTISSYISDIAIFIEFLKKEDLKLKDVTYDNVKQFLTEETLENISKRSNGRRIVSLRGFYNYLVKYHKFEKCQKCELLRFCRGCPAVSYGYSHNMYAPDPQCWKEV